MDTTSEPDWDKLFDTWIDEALADYRRKDEAFQRDIKEADRLAKKEILRALPPGGAGYDWDRGCYPVDRWDEAMKYRIIP